MTDPSWIAAALTASRPQAMAALLRYFRDLATAQEAFQEASLRAATPSCPPRSRSRWRCASSRACLSRRSRVRSS